MKTKQLFWGVLLIALGLLIFLNNIGQISWDWEELIKFWPLFFVLWGISLMIRCPRSPTRSRWSARPRSRFAASSTATESASSLARPRGRLRREVRGWLDGGVCWLIPAPRAAGGRLSRAAVGRERSEPALDCRRPVAYSLQLSQHTLRPDSPATRGISIPTPPRVLPAARPPGFGPGFFAGRPSCSAP